MNETQTVAKRSVAIIVTVREHATFLPHALQSCISQTVRPSEILVISFGANDELERLAASFPGVAVHRQENAGSSVAQYAGLAGVSSEFVIFLDADDRLTSFAI